MNKEWIKKNGLTDPFYALPIAKYGVAHSCECPQPGKPVLTRYKGSAENVWGTSMTCEICEKWL
jgi:hypothetical protein